jgi:predicted metal-binding transcription factor (methanogenesis marker protein 9)
VWLIGKVLAYGGEVRNQRKFYKIQIRFFCYCNKRCNIRGRLKEINFSRAGGLGVRHQLSIQKVPGSKPVGFELILFFCNYNRRCSLRGRLKKINFSRAGGLGVRHQLSIQKVPGSKPVGFL